MSTKIKIKDEDSGLGEFVRHQLPNKKDLEKFEKIASRSGRENFSSENNQEIDESLSEIYHDDKGNMVDVRKMSVMKKRGFVFWFLSSLFILAVFGSLGYGLYYYIFRGAAADSPISLKIEAQEEVLAGEEFFYDLTYKNSGNVAVKNAFIEVSYPDNFVYLDSSPQRNQVEKINDSESSVGRLKNSSWNIGDLKAGSFGHIKIKGKLIGSKGSENSLFANINYTPENFSSVFKKETVFSSEIKDIGFDLTFDSPSSVLVGAENEISISIKPQGKNFQKEFKLSIEQLENLEIISVASEREKQSSEENEQMKIEKVSANSYKISGIEELEENIKIKYKFTKKINSEENLIWRFSTEAEDKSIYIFHEEQISQEIMKNDLNLTLIVNGSKNDQGVSFGDTLNYSLNYANKGEAEMKDVAIMAVLDGSILDWDSLDDSHAGKVNGNAIIWTKEEIPELESLAQGQEGAIDFSIKINPYDEGDIGKDFTIKSYAQFSVGNAINKDLVNDDSKSNTIINKINTDLSLNEEIRYFSEDNVPVGSGPLPPRAGETTSFKVYWRLSNNIHELNSLKVETILPDNVKWDGRSRTSVGTVEYDAINNKVVWQIGRLPITVYRADAEFSISITPTDNDRNKIMVISSGSIAQAIDNETQANVESQTKAKTTRLEDDEIAGMNNDGRIE